MWKSVVSISFISENRVKVSWFELIILQIFLLFALVAIAFAHSSHHVPVHPIHESVDHHHSAHGKHIANGHVHGVSDDFTHYYGDGHDHGVYPAHDDHKPVVPHHWLHCM